MPYYIGTVWTLSATAAAVEGNAGIQRRVITRYAEDEASFKADVMDDCIHVPDDGVWFGPIGLSKDQRTRY